MDYENLDDIKRYRFYSMFLTLGKKLLVIKKKPLQCTN